MNFGIDASNATVTFGSTTATINSINATLINVTVPNGLSAGDAAVTVTVGGQSSNEAQFEVTELPVPTIDNISPVEGFPGTTVTINGTNFSNEDSENQVLFGDEEATITSATTTEIVVIVPSGLEAGEVSVSVTVNDRTSNLATFTVLAPSITGISPGIGPIGTVVTIEGINFSTEESGNIVTFGDVEATVTSATATTIQTTVPAGIVAGGLLITVTVNGIASNTFQFTVVGPQVNSLNPMSGIPGSQVIINGSNFSADIDQNSVSFGDVEAEVTSAAPNALEVTVPLLPQGEVDVSVTSNGLIAAGSATFEVIIPVRPLYWIEQAVGGNFEVIKGEIDNQQVPNVTTITVEESTANRINAIALDRETGEIYWVEETGDPFFGTTNTIRNSNGNVYAAPTDVLITSFAIDTQNDNIYWIQNDAAGSGWGIFSIDIQSNSTPRQLFGGESFQTLVALELDVNNNHLYFIENFDDGVSALNSRVYQGDFAGSTASIIYEQAINVQAGNSVAGFIDLAISNSSIFIAGTGDTSNPLAVSRIFEGALDGSSGSLSTVYESSPGSDNNPMLRIMGLTFDQEFSYLYWINYGERDPNVTPSNSLDGSIYRGPTAPFIDTDPQLLFSNLELPEATSNPIKNGRRKGRSQNVTVGFTF